MTLRSVDVLVYEWVGGKHDVYTWMVSPLVGLRIVGFTVGQVYLKSASSEGDKIDKTCSYKQHAFIPFDFDNFSFLAPKAMDLL